MVLKSVLYYIIQCLVYLIMQEWNPGTVILYQDFWRCSQIQLSRITKIGRLRSELNQSELIQ